jgi:hypothetical protein
MRVGTRRGERGAALVLMALMLFLAIGMSALVVDYGMIKASEAEAQRAMDAAALAGASAFLDPEDPLVDRAVIAESRAREYAARHEVHRMPIRAELDSGYVDVDVNLVDETVTASYTSPAIQLWFASVIGIPTMGITASATAEAGSVGRAVDCVKPFLVPDMWDETDPTQDLDGDKLWDGSLRGRDGGEDWIFEPDQGDRYVPFDPDAPVADQPYQTGLGSSYTSGGTSVPNLRGSTSGDYGTPMLIKGQLGMPDGQRTSMFYFLFDLNENMNTRDEINSCTESSRIAIGQPVPIKPGGTTGQVKHGVNDLMEQDPDAYWDYTSNTVVGSQPPPGSGIAPGNWNWSQSPRVITIALFDPHVIANGVMPGGGSEVTVTNMARMWLNDVDANDNVTAVFLGFTSGGAAGGEVGALIKVLRLIR